MRQIYIEHLAALQDVGWTVKHSARPQDLPLKVVDRYQWVPREIIEVPEGLIEASSGDQKAWLLGGDDYHGRSNAAFRWDEWEQQSLVAAAFDVEWRSEISRFWDQHFPIGLSVKSGYAYFAVNMTGLAVVVGEEPEFEDVRVIAPSALDFLAMIANRDSGLDRWV